MAHLKIDKIEVKDRIEAGDDEEIWGFVPSSAELLRVIYCDRSEGKKSKELVGGALWVICKGPLSYGKGQRFYCCDEESVILWDRLVGLMDDIRRWKERMRWNYGWEE